MNSFTAELTTLPSLETLEANRIEITEESTESVQSALHDEERTTISRRDSFVIDYDVHVDILQLMDFKTVRYDFFHAQKRIKTILR